MITSFLSDKSDILLYVMHKCTNPPLSFIPKKFKLNHHLSSIFNSVYKNVQNKDI